MAKMGFVDAGDERMLATYDAIERDLDRARATFERALACANDVGLLSEMSDETGAALGNTPQALSHVALIVAADAIGDAEREAAKARVAQAR